MSETQPVLVVNEAARRIMFAGDIDPDTSTQIINAMICMDDQAGPNGESLADVPIEFWITSSGGYETAAWAIVDVMQTLDAEVVTVGYGSVSSAATLPLLFGDARLVLPHAFVAIHGVAREVTPDGGRHDSVYHRRFQETMETERRLMALGNERYVKALVERAGWKAEDARNFIDEGRDVVFVGGEEIVANGFADGIFGGPEMEADDETESAAS